MIRQLDICSFKIFAIYVWTKVTVILYSIKNFKTCPKLWHLASLNFCIVLSLSNYCERSTKIFRICHWLDLNFRRSTFKINRHNDAFRRKFSPKDNLLSVYTQASMVIVQVLRSLQRSPMCHLASLGGNVATGRRAKSWHIGPRGFDALTF